MKYNIVLDTDVLASALRSNRGVSYKLLRMIDDERIILNLSTPLVKEYEDVLNRLTHNLDSQDVSDILDYLVSIAQGYKIHYLWRPILKDIKDDMVLELAVEAKSMIVTYNKGDFKGVEKFDITLLDPKEFLALLGEL
jgi:putative PIN family toxin of toxin-antitoxin system